VRALEYPLITPRLRLEPVTPELAAAARAGGQVFAEHIGADVPADWRNASLRMLARTPGASWDGQTAPIRAVAIHREEGCVIGDVRFEPVPLEPKLVELGYSIAVGWRRRGYALEAAGAVLDWLFDEGGAKAAIAGCERGNLASVKTLRKLGFWLDGSAGSAFWWTITPDLRDAARA
jgi:RimJ/RimL family protein N-acetyltransferase